MRFNHIKIWPLFYFATIDQIFLGPRSTQARDMTAPSRYLDMDSSYSSVVIIFVFDIALLKNQI